MIDPDSEEMRRIAFNLAIQAIDNESNNLRRAVRRNRRISWLLIFAVATNVGSTLLVLMT